MNQKAEFLPASNRNDTIEVLFNEESDEELTAAEKAAQAAIEQLNSNAEKGKTVRIYRQSGSGKESMQFVMSEPADKFTIDELIDIIMRKYGGGDYRFMIYNEKGKLSANKLISIATEKTPINNGSDNNAFSVLNSVLEKQERMTQLLFDKNNSGENSRMDFMKEMIMMKEFFGGGEQAAQKSPMGQMKEMMEIMVMLKDSANPEPKEEDNSFTKIFSEAVPLLTALAEGAQGKRPKAQPVNGYQGYQENPTRQTRQRKPKQEDKEMNMKKMAVNQLLEYCEQGHAPDAVAQELSLKIPDQFIPQIESLILGENPIDEIIKFNSKVKNNREWFVDCVEWLKGYLGHPSKYDDEFLDDDEIENDLNQEKADNETGDNSQKLQDSVKETIIAKDAKDE